ncbi:MAG: DNA repair protein RecO [Lachnospiraceae bacterium]|nr:DNA repair protein RecO [Lachnospiraceae bacterium]
MAFNIVLTGMVLQATPVGEYDKRVVILTKERGLITAFAKGARRAGNQMLAAANPFAFGQFEVYQGKNSYTAVKAEISNYFRDMANDFDKACYGYFFLEIAQYYAQENMDESERLLLLYQTCRVLESDVMHRDLIRAIYQWKTLAINGEYPNIYECRVCGNKKQLHYFSENLQGCICDNCHDKAGGYPISDSALYALQYVISSSIQKLYSFNLTEEVEGEFIETVLCYFKKFEIHKFKSLDFLG